MQFERYYRALFRRDLQRVIDGLRSYHQDEDVVAIQPRTLSTLNPVVRRWDRDRQLAFASGLYLTILVDEVCWTYFRQHYDAFRRLTLYPKFLGDCPGGCFSHLEPYVVFKVVGKRAGAGPDECEFDGTLSFPAGFVEGMEKEIADFCSNQMPELAEQGFWRYCEREIHLLQSLARPRERHVVRELDPQTHVAPQAAPIVTRQPELPFTAESTIESYPDGHWGGLKVTTHAGRLHLFHGLLPAFERRPFRIANEDGRLTQSNRALQAIVRSDTQVPVGVVSKGYQLVQHQALFSEILQALSGLGIDADKVDGSLSLTPNAERMALSVLFPDTEQFTYRVGPDDSMRFRIECFNSVDGSARLMLVAGWLRFVCKNGLVVGRRVVDLRERHTSRLDFSRVAASIRNGIGEVERGRQLCEEWRSTAIRGETLKRWIDGPLRKAWGVKAAARVFWVCNEGRDVVLTEPFENAVPSERTTEFGNSVPGAARPARTLFDVAQALAWIAGQRADRATRQKGAEEVELLLRVLRDGMRRRTN